MKTAKRSSKPFYRAPWPRALWTAAVTLLCLTACRYGEAKGPPAPQDVSLPARAAFYYPWFPETWAVNGTEVSALPVLDYYSSDDVAVIDAHIKALAHAKVEVAIASWWGVGTHYEQERIPKLLEQTRGLGSPLKWTFYYEKEGQGDPSISELQADLAYLRRAYVGSTSAVIDGKPVIFVYNADDADCEVAERWRAAAADWYVVLKVFPGYRDCAAQPSSWHQYGPAEAADQQVGFSYSISPGFWRADEPAPRLPRNLDRWRQNVREMVAAGDPWQLVTTFNEWGEGTAVEEAKAWKTGDYGAYLDALASDGVKTAASAPRSFFTGDAVTVAAVGDIACDPASESFERGEGTLDNCRQQYVADLVAQGGADVFLPLGDIQYEEGTPEQFSRSYDPSFGRYLNITYPIVGNHEYLTVDAAGYYGYFGERAGDPEKGYYSFDLGAWHVVALNSNCSEVGGCEPGSPQERWLRADLAANPSRCTLAYMHHPRFSSGHHGNNNELEAFWSALHDFGTEIVLSGHDHIYERFAPQTADGAFDPESGIRQFIVGTGGKNHTEIEAIKPHSELQHSGTYGLLELVLEAERYRWTFVPEAGQRFTDSGSENCHR